MSNIIGGSAAPPWWSIRGVAKNQGGGKHRGVSRTPLILTGGWRHPPGPPLKPPLVYLQCNKNISNYKDMNCAPVLGQGIPFTYWNSVWDLSFLEKLCVGYNIKLSNVLVEFVFIVLKPKSWLDEMTHFFTFPLIQKKISIILHFWCFWNLKYYAI